MINTGSLNHMKTRGQLHQALVDTVKASRLTGEASVEIRNRKGVVYLVVTHCRKGGFTFKHHSADVKDVVIKSLRQNDRKDPIFKKVTI